MSCCGAQFDWCSWMGPGLNWHCNNPEKMKRQFSVSEPEKLGTLCESKPAKTSAFAWIKGKLQLDVCLCALVKGHRGHCQALLLMQSFVLIPVSPMVLPKQVLGMGITALSQVKLIQSSSPISVCWCSFSPSLCQMILEGIALLYRSKVSVSIDST